MIYFEWGEGFWLLRAAGGLGVSELFPTYADCLAHYIAITKTA